MMNKMADTMSLLCSKREESEDRKDGMRRLQTPTPIMEMAGRGKLGRMANQSKPVPGLWEGNGAVA